MNELPLYSQHFGRHNSYSRSFLWCEHSYSHQGAVLLTPFGRDSCFDCAADPEDAGHMISCLKCKVLFLPQNWILSKVSESRQGIRSIGNTFDEKGSDESVMNKSLQNPGMPVRVIHLVQSF